MSGKRQALRAVQGAARKAASAHAGLTTAMCYASAEGASLREIATAAGVSHEQVRRVLSPARVTASTDDGRLGTAAATA